MELKFSKEKTIKLLEKYYQEEKDFTGKVTIKASTGSVGYGMHEMLGCILEMKIKGELDFMGEKITGEQRITEKDVEEAFKFYLDKAGYEVKKVSLDSGTTDSTEGYGLAEHTVTRSYFSGVNVITKEKVKKIGGK